MYCTISRCAVLYYNALHCSVHTLSCFLPSSVLVQLSLNCLLVNSFGSVREPSTEEGSRTEPKLLTRRQFSESWTKTEEGRKQERDMRRSASAHYYDLNVCTYCKVQSLYCSVLYCTQGPRSNFEIWGRGRSLETQYWEGGGGGLLKKLFLTNSL